MTLDELAREIREINTTNGWNVLKEHEWADDYKIPAIISLIHSELSEALEAFREGNLAHFLEELGDVIIRCLDCAGAFDVSMDGVVAAKLAKNKTRGYRHGGKKV